MVGNGRLVRMLLLAAAGGLFGAGCGSGNGVANNGASSGKGTIGGMVVQAPVSGATVTAYKLDAGMTRGAVLGTATTADGTSGGPAAGSFSLTVGPYNGPLELVASGGSYIDEATGVATQMAGYDLSAIVGNYQSSSAISVTISPISLLAAAAARFDVQAHGTAAATAVDSAYGHLNAHFGGLDWRTVIPVDLASVTNLTAAGTAALVLAALSDEAMQISQSVGGSAGATVTAAMLAQALSQDIANDGVLDGQGPSGQISLGPVSSTHKLDGTSVRFSLATALQDFVQRKALTSLGPDALALASTIAANADPYLFKSAGLSLNTTPPPVALVSPGSGAGPYYTNTATTTVTATATDLGNGVGAVHARATSGSTTTAGTLANGIWTLSNIPLSAGPNSIQVWASDKAKTGAASSCVPAGGSTPSNCVTLTVVYNNVSPLAQVVAGTSKYCDEATMTVGGATPPVYSFPGGCSQSDVAAGAAIHKAASRITPASTHSAADLENGNPDNLPWIPFSISLYGAPLASATYSITTFPGSTSGNSHTYTGDLLPWLSPKSTLTGTTGLLYFDLPLDAVRIPELISNVGATPFTIRVTATDTAGNSATPCVFSAFSTSGYHVLAPPLAWSEDTNYVYSGDSRSTHAYTIAQNSYGALYDGAEPVLSSGNAVRLIRYVVTNPGPLSVALDLAPGAWASTETWDAVRFDTQQRPTYGDGYNTYPYYGCARGSCNSPSTDVCSNATDACVAACGGSTSGFWYPADGHGEMCSSAPNWTGVSGAVASATATPLPYILQSGTETAASTKSVHGRYVIPAATSGTSGGPGVMVVYIARPYSVARTLPAIGAGLGWAFPPPTLTSKTGPWRQNLGEVFTDVVPGYCCGPGVTPAACRYAVETQGNKCTTRTYTYKHLSFYLELKAAQETVTGSWQPATYALSAAGDEIGELTVSTTTYSYTRTITK